jgi:hypothetical protein
MAFQAQFIRFRSEDNHPMPVGLPAQVVALTADEAMEKLKGLVADEKWAPTIHAVRLFENGREIDSYIRPIATTDPIPAN